MTCQKDEQDLEKEPAIHQHVDIFEHLKMVGAEILVEKKAHFHLRDGVDAASEVGRAAHWKSGSQPCGSRSGGRRV